MQPQTYATRTSPFLALWLLIAAIGLAAVFASPAHAQTSEGSNPNQYECKGYVGVGQPEVGSEEHQVLYAFHCDGPITGYQIQSQIPLTGFEASPLVSDLKGQALTDTFACGGEVPGFAVNCVGVAKAGGELVTGQIAIGTHLCKPPLIDPLLTVTYAYIEKGTLTQAISGPYDLGRPYGCAKSAYRTGTRLNPRNPSASVKRSARRGHRKHAHAKHKPR